MTNPIKTDQELSLLIKFGDQTAFKDLHTRYYRSLYYFMMLKCKNDDVVKDILQDSFLKFWNSRDQLNPEKQVKALLFTIANNSWIDYQRKLSNSHLSLLDLNENEEIEDYSTDSNEPSDQIDRLKTIIASQPEAIKQIYVLSKVEGYKNHEIAEILNISVKTVEARMTKLIKTIREKLTKPDQGY